MDLFTNSDSVTLATVYASALPDADAREADMLGGVHLSDAALVAVANYAAEIALANAGVRADGSLVTDSTSLTAPTIDGAPVDPLLNVLALLTEQVSRIADNTGHAEVGIPVEVVLEQWEKAGMRIDEDLAVRFVESLPGVLVEK